jgi:hypothetical protein
VEGGEAGIGEGVDAGGRRVRRDPSWCWRRRDRVAVRPAGLEVGMHRVKRGVREGVLYKRASCAVSLHAMYDCVLQRA